MPVNATIPLTQDFLQTAGTYPLLTELIQHPTNGYLYGCYTEAGVGKILKLKNDDYTDVTVASLPVAAPIDMHYSVTNDRFYVVYRTTNSPVTEVHPTTLAMVAFFSITSVGGQGAITGDTANLYVATFSTQKLYSISLATGLQVGLRTMPATGYAKINCLRYFSPKLYALSMDVDYVQLSRIVPATLGTEEVSTPIGIDAGEVPVDDMGESSGHIYVGNRDLLGIIRKFSKTDFLNPELIETTQLSKCTCTKTVGLYVWAAFENGRGVRINPTNIPDRRAYTLNDGQGYHSEFTGLGSEFVHTYNLSTSKIQRYHIPPDVVSGQFQWAKAGDVSIYAAASAVATDRDGNVFIVGRFQNDLNFGSGNIPFIGGYDNFVAKYNSSGTFLWARSFGSGSSQDEAYGVATDSNGNVIVVGAFAGTVDFGGVDAPADKRTVNGATDIFVAKYSPGSLGVQGTLLWVRNFGGTFSDFGKAVAVDPDDNIVLAAECVSTSISFDAFPLTNTLGNTLAALVKLNRDTGVAMWARGTETQAVGVNAVTVDPSGNAIFAGGFFGTANFGDGNRVSNGSFDIFIAKYLGTDGTFNAGSGCWIRTMGSAPESGRSGSDSARGIACDPSGNVYVTGSYAGTTDFGGAITNAFGTINNIGGIFIASYTNAGVFRWAFTPNVPEIGFRNDFGNAIAADATGVYYTGQVQAQVCFKEPTFLTGADTDYFVASVTHGGVYQWAKRSGGSSPNAGAGISADRLRHVVTTGRFVNSTMFLDNNDRTNGGSVVTESGTTAPFVAQYST